MGRGALACWQVGVAQQAYQSREHSRLLNGLDSHSSSHLLLQTYHAQPVSVSTSCVDQALPILLHTNSIGHYSEAVQVLGERCQLPQLIRLATAEGFVCHGVTL